MNRADNREESFTLRRELAELATHLSNRDQQYKVLMSLFMENICLRGRTISYPSIPCLLFQDLLHRQDILEKSHKQQLNTELRKRRAVAAEHKELNNIIDNLTLMEYWACAPVLSARTPPAWRGCC